MTTREQYIEVLTDIVNNEYSSEDISNAFGHRTTFNEILNDVLNPNPEIEEVKYLRVYMALYVIGEDYIDSDVKLPVYTEGVDICIQIKNLAQTILNSLQ